MFVPSSQSFHVDILHRDIWVHSGKLQLHGWVVEPNQIKQKLVVLLCHGNAGNVCHTSRLLAPFLDLGLKIVVFDYPGYGESQGLPSEQGCYDAGLAFYDQLILEGTAPSDIILVGFSLGGPIAADIALKREHRNLLLLSTFYSPRRLMETFWKPLWLLSFVSSEFRLNERLELLRKKDPSKCATKYAVLHSKQDGLISYDHAEANSQSLGCKLITISGSHPDPLLFEPVLRELSEVLDLEKSPDFQD